MRIGSSAPVEAITRSAVRAATRRSSNEQDLGAGKLLLELPRPLAAAVGHPQLAGSALHQGTGHRAGDLAGAEEQHPAVLQPAEDVARQLHRWRSRARPRRRRSPSPGGTACPGRERRCAAAGVSTGPSAPTASASAAACLTWPRISGSPSTIDSRPLATARRWRAASPLRFT